MNKQKKFVRAGYWLTPAQAQFVRNLAFRKGISQSELVRDVIKLIKRK